MGEASRPKGCIDILVIREFVIGVVRATCAVLRILECCRVLSPDNTEGQICLIGLFGQWYANRGFGWGSVVRAQHPT
jgi:hypothetical protein